MAKKIVYLTNTLSKDEEILGVAEIHWFAFVMAFLLPFIAFTFFGEIFGADKDVQKALAVLGILFGCYQVLSLIKTEMIATNKRVLLKKGIIAVKTEELKNAKVEGVAMNQSFLGRILGYSDILLSGTGTTKITFERVKAPIFVKSKFEEIIENHKK